MSHLAGSAHNPAKRIFTARSKCSHPRELHGQCAAQGPKITQNRGGALRRGCESSARPGRLNRSSSGFQRHPSAPRRGCRESPRGRGAASSSGSAGPIAPASSPLPPSAKPLQRLRGKRHPGRGGSFLRHPPLPPHQLQPRTNAPRARPGEEQRGVQRVNRQRDAPSTSPTEHCDTVNTAALPAPPRLPTLRTAATRARTRDAGAGEGRTAALGHSRKPEHILNGLFRNGSILNLLFLLVCFPDPHGRAHGSFGAPQRKR